MLALCIIPLFEELLWIFFPFGLIWFQIKKRVFCRREIRRQKHLQLGNQKENEEEVGWVVECVETNRWNPAAGGGYAA